MNTAFQFQTPEDRLRSLLLPGERLLWSGRPRQGFLLRPSDAALIPFSLLWGGFAIFWEASVIRTNAPFFFRLWGVPFVLIGLYMIVGRFIADFYRRRSITYGVTSERIIVTGGWPVNRTHSFELDTIRELTFTERPSGGGTVSLANPTVFNKRNQGFGSPEPGTLELASDARHVHDLIRQTKNERHARHP